MKLNLLKHGFLLAIILTVASCGDDDGFTLGSDEYENGLIVINEGNFTDGDASVSFIDGDQTFVGIFSVANNGKALGDVANDAMIKDDQLFIVVNNSNKMEVLDKNSMDISYTMVNLAQPRNVISDGSTGYLSEWVGFGVPGRVTTFDMATGAIGDQIAAGSGAEDMLIIDDFLYVSNQFEKSVSVIDLSDNSLETTISVGSNPDDMILDTNGKIWLVCQGGYQSEPPYDLANDGQLIRINPSTNMVEATIELNANVPGRLATDASAEAVYFTIGTDVYVMDAASTTLPSAKISISDAVSLYGIAVDPANGDIYALDSKGFQSNGEAFHYSSSGDLIDTYSVGRGPNMALFN